LTTWGGENHSGISIPSLNLLLTSVPDNFITYVPLGTSDYK
jgi:hypothetical protein